MVRNLRSVKRKLSHGKPSTIQFKTSADLFAESYQNLVKNDLPKIGQSTTLKHAKYMSPVDIKQVIDPKAKKPAPPKPAEKHIRPERSEPTTSSDEDGTIPEEKKT